MQGIFIAPSEVIEYLYCPRFTFFMNCLCIPQHEEQRYKVLKGREIHQEKSLINKSYLRKRLDCIDKETSVYMASEKYHIKGIVDEVLYLGDGTLAPLDFKFTEYNDKLFNTHKTQSVLYALMIQENYNKEVKKGFICYTRSKNYIRNIIYTERDFKKSLGVIDEMLMIIQTGFYPKRTKYLVKCVDCCYKNICV